MSYNEVVIRTSSFQKKRRNSYSNTEAKPRVRIFKSGEGTSIVSLVGNISSLFLINILYIAKEIKPYVIFKRRDDYV